MGTGRVKIKTPTMAQKPPMALPVIDEGVWVPYPTVIEKAQIGHQFVRLVLGTHTVIFFRDKGNICLDVYW